MRASSNRPLFNKPNSQTPAVSPVVSINALMVALVDHASHELWNVEKEGGAPKNDQAWQEVEHHATQLAGAGTLIAVGGTGQADPGWAQSPEWKKYSGQLNEAGLAAAERGTCQESRGARQGQRPARGSL